MLHRILGGGGREGGREREREGEGGRGRGRERERKWNDIMNESCKED